MAKKETKSKATKPIETNWVVKGINWIEDHPATMTFFSGVLTLCLILITYYFYSKNKESADSMNRVTQGMYKVSRDQYTLSKNVQTKSDSSNFELQQKNEREILWQDSLRQEELVVSRAQANAVIKEFQNQFRVVQPRINLDNIKIYNKSVDTAEVVFCFRNLGALACRLTNVFIDIYNPKHNNDFTSSINTYHFQIGDGIDYSASIYVPKSVLENSDTLYYYELDATDTEGSDKPFYPYRYFKNPNFGASPVGFLQLYEDEIYDFIHHLKKKFPSHIHSNLQY